MAISYCWGKSPHEYVTAASNLEERLGRLDFSVLPKTIQEAIVTAGMLWNQYLWVDAVCIIQPKATNPDSSD